MGHQHQLRQHHSLYPNHRLGHQPRRRVREHHRALPNTTYHYRILATNPGGTTYGTDQTFSTQPGSTVSGSGTGQTVTTQSGPPSPVITGAPAVTGPNGAAFSGLVNPHGWVTTAYFQYGIPPNAQGPEGAGPTFTQFTSTQAIGSDFSSHAVSASVSGLVPNEIYDVQLVATNSAGNDVRTGGDIHHGAQRAAATAGAWQAGQRHTGLRARLDQATAGQVARPRRRQRRA